MDHRFVTSIKRGVGYWLGLRAKDIVITQFFKDGTPPVPVPRGYQHCMCEWIHKPTRASGECLYIFRDGMPQLPPAVIHVNHISEWTAEIPPDDVLTVFAPDEEA